MNTWHKFVFLALIIFAIVLLTIGLSGIAQAGDPGIRCPVVSWQCDYSPENDYLIINGYTTWNEIGWSGLRSRIIPVAGIHPSR